MPWFLAGDPPHVACSRLRSVCEVSICEMGRQSWLMFEIPQRRMAKILCRFDQFGQKDHVAIDTHRYMSL